MELRYHKLCVLCELSPPRMDCTTWQAIRTLHQVAEGNVLNEETQWVIILLLYGATTTEAEETMIRKITAAWEQGKCPLTKWGAN